MNLLQYILISALCLSLFYAAFRLIFKKETNFRQMRFFLLGSVLLSLLIPLNRSKINPGITFPRKTHEAASAMKSPTELSEMNLTGQLAGRIRDPESPREKEFNWQRALTSLYFIVTAALLIRILLLMGFLALQYLKSIKKIHKDYILLYNPRFKNAFSFFRLIFIPDDLRSGDDIEKVLAHEKIHVLQYHSLDQVILEILVSLMWFNPVVWKMRNSMHLIHEYLADEGALATGIDRLQYQELLINRIAGERLISFSSGFDHSIIKKRIIMMTKGKIFRKNRYRFMALVPLSAALLLMVACLNGVFSEPVRAETAYPEIRMNTSESFPFGSLAKPADQGDTIRKTVIREIRRDTVQDTIVVRTINRKVKGDSASKVTMIKIVKNVDVNVKNDINNEFDYEYLIEDGNDSVVSSQVIRENNIIKIRIANKNDNAQNKEEDKPSNTLIIIDGIKHIEKNAMMELDPDQIVSVEVIKNKNDIKKYTDKEYQGVIIIVTKDPDK